LGRGALKQLPPERLWRINLDAAVLEQATLAPQLGTADALAAVGMHQIGGGTEAKTAGGLGRGGLAAELQRQAELRKGLLQPEAGPPIHLLATPGGIRPHQGVGEVSAMEHGSTATGPAHQIDHALACQLQPMGLQAALVMAQR